MMHIELEMDDGTTRRIEYGAHIRTAAQKYLETEEMMKHIEAGGWVFAEGRYVNPAHIVSIKADRSSDEGVTPEEDAAAMKQVGEYRRTEADRCTTTRQSTPSAWTRPSASLSVAPSAGRDGQASGSNGWTAM